MTALQIDRSVITIVIYMITETVVCACTNFLKEGKNFIHKRSCNSLSISDQWSSQHARNLVSKFLSLSSHSLIKKSVHDFEFRHS